MKKTSIFIYLIFGWMIWTITACSTSDTTKTAPEQIDLKKAKSFQDAGRYDLALEKFEMIKNKYPLTAEATEAELQIAETYYLQGSYVEALAYFQSFQNLHPHHRKIDWVTFRIAMCHYQQIPSTIDRDLTPATKAVEAFSEFLATYPKSSYAKEALDHKKNCLKRLSEKEFYIANFYFDRKKYQAALGRFQNILKQYPQAGLEEKVLFKMGACYYYLQDKKKAKEFLLKFIHRYPKSSDVSSANALLKKL